jgi:hypothetical protein
MYKVLMIGATFIAVAGVPVVVWLTKLVWPATWEGVVHVFNLEGHPKATRAYAWSSPLEGSDRRRFYAVLHLGGIRIRSPLDAVRAAIVAERRLSKQDGRQ